MAKKEKEDIEEVEQPEATEETVADTEETTSEETAAEEVEPEVEPEVDTEPPGVKEDPTLQGPTISRDDVPTRVMAAGTVLMFGGQKVTLAEAAQVSYDRAQDEPFFASLCRMSDNYETNKHLLEHDYDMHGVRVMPDPE